MRNLKDFQIYKRRARRFWQRTPKSSRVKPIMNCQFLNWIWLLKRSIPWRSNQFS